MTQKSILDAKKLIQKFRFIFQIFLLLGQKILRHPSLHLEMNEKKFIGDAYFKIAQTQKVSDIVKVFCVFHEIRYGQLNRVHRGRAA